MADILIAIGIALLTSATAYMGVRVTFRPPSEEKKGTWEFGFIAVGIAAVVLIGWQTFRNVEEQNSLHAQLDKILPPHYECSPLKILFSQPDSPGMRPSEIVVFTSVNDPVDDVSIAFMRSDRPPEAKPQYEWVIEAGTVVPHLAEPFPIPASISPYQDKTSSYQIMITTRYKWFMEFLDVTPRADGIFDQKPSFGAKCDAYLNKKRPEKASKP